MNCATTVLHYTGHRIAAPGRAARFRAEAEPIVAAAIAAVLDALSVGHAFGSLAAGADILFAEALLAHGASLHLVLPFDPAGFKAVSVRPSGAGWTERFDHTLAKATEIRILDGTASDDSSYLACTRAAIDLAITTAADCGAGLVQLAVWDGRRPRRLAGTAADVSAWRAHGLETRIIQPG